MPKYGSTYVPFSTRAPTTVFGTRALCQPAVPNPTVETASPLAETWAEDWRLHPCASAIRASPASSADKGGAAAAASARARVDRSGQRMGRPPVPRARGAVPGPEINPGRAVSQDFLRLFTNHALDFASKMPPRTTRVSHDGGARHAAHLRGLNLERVLNVAMDRPGSFTRAELIEATGLSAPTVGSLAADLIRSGVVKDLGTGPSSGGRRPFAMELNARHGYVAGIDLGPTRTRLAVADLRGDRIAERIVDTPGGVGPAVLLQRIAGSLRELMRDSNVPEKRLLVVGAGAPGAVEGDTGIVSFAPNLKDWTRVPMRDILERALGVRVVVENDVNLAILGERWQG